MDIQFWQSIVEITQIPNMEKRDFEDISWLGNPFNDQSIFKTKFSIGKDTFSWKFYMNTDNKRTAMRLGISLLSYLKELYTGLDGTVRVKSIGTTHLQKKRPYLFELILPDPPYLNNQIPLIQKIINLTEFDNEHKISINIFWQFQDRNFKPVFRDDTGSISRYEFFYNLRIFIEVQPNFNQNIEREKQIDELLGYLDYLTTDIQSKDGFKAIRKETEFPAENLLTMADLFNRAFCIETSIFDGDTKSFSKKMRTIDFSIPSNMPLDKACIVYNENLGIPVKEPKILLGNVYRQGVLTKRKIYMQLHKLVHHIFISGVSGVGKTRFLGFLANEVKKKDENIGLLVINLVKEGEEDLYNPDIILRKRDSDFRVPYFIPDKEIETICKEVAAYLVSSLGLKNVVLSITKNVLYDDCIKNGSPKQHPVDVFRDVLEWLKNNPYHPKFNTNIKRAIENRVLNLLSSPFIKNILELGAVPKWFIEWTKGKDVYIDLCNFTDDGKRLISHAILQMIRTLLPQLKTDELKYMIIIDEAHEILKKPKNQMYDDDETVTRHHLENVFEDVLESFRSRGVCLTIADQLPYTLFEGVYKLPSIKVIFRSEKEFLQYITNHLEEQDSLMNQKNQRALILDGVNSRKFAIHTIDYAYQKRSIKSKFSNEEFCPNCNVLLDLNFKFCKKCGTII